MNRSTVVAILLTVLVIVGAAIVFLSTDGHEEPLLKYDPPPPSSRGEVFFINTLARIPLPLNTPTVIERMEVRTIPPEGSGGWETTVTRTATHLTITHQSAFAGKVSKEEHHVPLSDLPMEFPKDKIAGMVVGRFEIAPTDAPSSPRPSVR